jgi:DUF1365 family protein
MPSLCAWGRASMPRPELCFGHVWHQRVRPLRHAFRYRTFYLRLPLRALEAEPPRVPLFGWNRLNLLSFNTRDHGDGSGNLTGWIDQLLHAHGVTDADGEVWLQAMPRVLAYVFNPVSFWFCHRRDGSLRAILCEVRNTFGERHCYLLDGAMAARKVLHVSPFFRVEGSYDFRFGHGAVEIDYRDSEDIALRTRLSGIPGALTTRAVLRAVLAYPFMTLGVVFHIHWQALQLWLRGVPFHSKPMPPVRKVSR